MNILVCTLGTSWQIIPEILGVLDPQRCPLYQEWPQAADQIRAQLQPPPPDEIWVITTSGTRGEDELRTWWKALDHPGHLRLWRTASHDGSAQAEVEHIRELIHRAVLHAGPDAILCLSGGRKTMSADLQRAGMAYGCRAMLHVLPPEPVPEQLKQCPAAQLARPLPREIAQGIQPVVVGVGHRLDLLDIHPAINAVLFPLPPEGLWAGPGKEGKLYQALDQRERDGSVLLANFHAGLAHNEAHENWRSLYQLPPAVIQRLRETVVTIADREWLRRIPKADLHCHIGGVLDLDEQIAVGSAVWKSVSGEARKQASLDARAWLLACKKSGGDRWTYDDKQRRANAAACLLSETDREVLIDALWTVTEPRLGLNESHRWKFKAYEHPGSLVGSTILQCKLATVAYAAAIKQRCQCDGISYLEVRCSPLKYYPQFLDDFHEALNSERSNDDPIIRIIVIADRRQDKTIHNVVRLALDARARLSQFIVGLDLAGDEKRGDPKKLSRAFREAFEKCLRITIHAGEGEPAANIWKSAYHLHADRIGHGLTLAELGAADLAARFRDRHICLELCPTSNREVVGYCDPDYSGVPTPYPLRQLMDLGVPLTVCTDNPGISRTTLADEYLAAARMTAGGLSQWEALALIKQAFLHAFLPAAERERLIKKMDRRIFEFIQGI